MQSERKIPEWLDSYQYAIPCQKEIAKQRTKDSGERPCPSREGGGIEGGAGHGPGFHLRVARKCKMTGQTRSGVGGRGSELKRAW